MPGLVTRAARSRQSTAVFTVANRRLATNAAILLKDLARTNPSWTRVLVTADALDAKPLPRLAGAATLNARDLAMPEALAFTVGLSERAALAAFVPWAFAALFAHGYERVVFLGPLVRCYSPLRELGDALKSSDATLVPRVLRPFADTLAPGMRQLREAGHFDSSLLGLKNTAATRHLARWWMDAWRGHWLREPYGQSEVVQEQIDEPTIAALEMIPAMLDRPAVLRVTNYHVGLWNLHERELTPGPGPGEWRLAGGAPLRTVNFDGLAGTPAAHSRVRPNAWPTWLRQLVEDYDASLRRSRTSKASANDDPLERLLPIPEKWRREVLDAPMVKGAVLTAGSRKSARDILHDFLRLPDPELPAVPRLLAEARRQIASLQRDTRGLPPAETHERLLAWYRADDGRTAGVSLSAPAARRRAASQPRVNVYGYFTCQSGLAEAARSTVRMLSRPISDCRAVNYLGGSPAPYAHPGISLSLPHANPALEIVHVNSDGTPLFHGTHPEVWNRGSYKIGYWLWELETPPAGAHEHAYIFDEIWCASEFNRACFQQLGDVPVRLAPLLVNPDLARIARAAKGRLPASRLANRPHLFLTISDFFSCPERKNPLAAIEAYVAAFPRDNGETGLLVKVSNTGIRPDYLEGLRRAVRGRRDIDFLLENLDASGLAGLVANAAALVSLHTTEGYGLPIAEALALGRPVIATGYGGNIEFCQQPDARLVRYAITTLDRRLGPYTPGTRWAAPDLDDAARAYREIYHQRRNSRDRFRPRVEEFNRAAKRLGHAALEAALARSATHPGKQFHVTRLSVAIFGASVGGVRLANQLNRRHDVVCFIDNDHRKIGGTMMGLPIVPPDRVRELALDKILIGSIYSEEIRKQLLALGVTPERMTLFPTRPPSAGDAAPAAPGAAALIALKPRVSANAVPGR